MNVQKEIMKAIPFILASKPSPNKTKQKAPTKNPGVNLTKDTKYLCSTNFKTLKKLKMKLKGRNISHTHGLAEST